METINQYSPGNLVERKAAFTRMVAEAKRFTEPDDELQAKIIINMAYDVKANQFSATAKAMIKLLKLYPRRLQRTFSTTNAEDGST